MHKTSQTKKLGQLLLVLALLATSYALFFYSESDKGEQKRASVLFQNISPQQEAIVMTSGLLFALGLFCIFPRKPSR